MNHSVWPKLLVNLGMNLDREYKHDDADSCFRAANRIACRSKFVTKKFIIDNFCRPLRLIEKNREKEQIESIIHTLKPGENRIITQVLFQERTLVNKQIKALEAMQ